MILELDFGNSRIKWRFLHFLQENNSAAPVHHAASLAELLARLGDCEKPLAIRLASVRSDDTVAEFSHWVSQQWQLQPLIARSAGHCAGVNNSYADESRMGVDRWLAMLGAYDRAKGACIIVDSGTALTVDVLAANGNHVGGYILPGLKLMADALEANTGIRLQPEDEVPGTAPGRNTEQAVRNGALAAAAALIEATCRRSAAEHSDLEIYLSGGDAALISASLSAPGAVQILPDLVLDGLALACPVGAP